MHRLDKEKKNGLEQFKGQTMGLRVGFIPGRKEITLFSRVKLSVCSYVFQIARLTLKGGALRLGQNFSHTK